MRPQRVSVAQLLSSGVRSMLEQTGRHHREISIPGDQTVTVRRSLNENCKMREEAKWQEDTQ